MITLMNLTDWINHTAKLHDRVIYTYSVTGWTCTFLRSPFAEDYRLLQSKDGRYTFVIHAGYYFIVSDDLYTGQLFYALIDTDLSVYDNHISELDGIPWNLEGVK